MAFLQVEGLSKRFGDAQVLSDVSFTMEKGDVLAMIGSSGSGKTTLLRCLNFLERADEGRILLEGQPLFDSENRHAMREKEIRRRRLHFGLVFQHFNLFPQYTALQNVMLAKELLASSDASWRQKKAVQQTAIREEAEALLTQMGLKDRMGHYPHQLSGGQQQRVAIARALILQPDILCFDEPTSALDPELTGEVLRVIRDLANRATTMIIVTHEMSFARNVSTQVMFMDAGRICEIAPPEELFAAPKQPRTQQFLSSFG